MCVFPLFSNSKDQKLKITKLKSSAEVSSYKRRKKENCLFYFWHEKRQTSASCFHQEHICPACLELPSPISSPNAEKCCCTARARSVVRQRRWKRRLQKASGRPARMCSALKLHSEDVILCCRTRAGFK